MRCPRAFLAFVVSAVSTGPWLAACGDEPHATELFVELEPASLLDRVAWIALEIRDDTGAVVYRGELSSDEAGPRPMRLGPGAYDLSAEARDVDCVVFASGMLSVDLPTDAAVVLTLEAIPVRSECVMDQCVAGRCSPDPTDGGRPDAGPGRMDAGPDDRDAGDFDAAPPDGCVAMPEACNGADDDCDANADEDFTRLGETCNRGTGICRTNGMRVCNAAGDGVVCGAVPGTPEMETCDGEDDDCDGSTDEGFGLGSGCTVGVGACLAMGTDVCDGSGGVTCSATPGTPGTETCGDGMDEDCDGSVDEGCMSYRSCAVALAAGVSADGVYPIRDRTGAIRSVYCDQSTDGGGWTLVASTRNTMLNDEASSYYSDLSTLAPASGHTGVWDGLRGLAATFDLRFACRASVGAATAPFTVDLSFYSVIWYGEITTGSDSMCCFSESNGRGADPPPARRDNVAGISLPAGNPWNAAGYLEGEDGCSDSGDFTVDFDDRGMDANENDGTDWGEDDGSRKCGTRALSSGQWFIFARER